jgi:hypothetical protein
VDSGDLSSVDNVSASFGNGYISEDVNGDRMVDSADIGVVVTNSNAFIRVIKPRCQTNKTSEQQLLLRFQ